MAMPRLKESYQKKIVPEIMKEFGYTNINQVPRIEKVRKKPEQSLKKEFLKLKRRVKDKIIAYH